VGYAKIRRRPYREEPTSLPYVDHVDAEGRLYLRTNDEATGVPVVQVLQLSIALVPMLCVGTLTGTLCVPSAGCAIG